MCGAVLAHAEPHDRTPLVARYMDGGLAASGVVADGTADGGVEAAVASDPRFTASAPCTAGATSMRISSYAAEAVPRRNERLERGVHRQRGWRGVHSDAAAVMAHKPLAADAFAMDAAAERGFIGAAGKHSMERSRHDVGVMPGIDSPTRSRWSSVAALPHGGTPSGGSGRSPRRDSESCSREGGLVKALLAGAKQPYDELVTAAVAADSAATLLSPGQPAAGAAGLASCCLERRHFASGETSVASGLSGTRPRGRRILSAPLRMPDAAGTAPRRARLNRGLPAAIPLSGTEAVCLHRDQPAPCPGPRPGSPEPRWEILVGEPRGRMRTW